MTSRANTLVIMHEHLRTTSRRRYVTEERTVPHIHKNIFGQWCVIPADMRGVDNFDAYCLAELTRKAWEYAAERNHRLYGAAGLAP
jgi:hypothetical protein